MKIKQVVFLFILKIWFIALFLLVIGRDFFALAQEAIPAANKSEILKYREQQDIFSDDLHGLGYIEAAQILNDETSSAKKLLYYCKQGKDYFDSRRYEKALVEFKNALDWNPQYKPALKYVEIIEEKIRRGQQLKEKQDLAERKAKQAAQKRQEKEDARLSRKEKIKYEQNIKQEQESYRNLKKINEARIKALLDARTKQYESDKIIQKEFAWEQEKIKAENAKLENFARIKAEKEQLEKFRGEKLAKEKNIQRRNLEEKTRLAELQRQRDSQARIAAEEILLSEREKTKHEQIIKLEQEKSRNFKGLNEARFREKLSQKLKEEDLIEQSRKELPQSQNIPEVKGLETAIAPSMVVSPDLSGAPQAVAAASDNGTKPGQQAAASNDDKYKEFIADNFVPDSLELAKIQQGFEDKYTKLLKETETIKKNYNNLLAQVKELLADSERARELDALLERNNSDLELYKKENERVKKDYNNLLLQVKMLLVYRQRIKELEGLLEYNKIDISSLEKEKEVAILEKNELKRKNKKLDQSQAQMLKERDSYKDAYEKLKDNYEKLYSEAVTNKLKVKEFTNNTPVLERKNKDLELELKQLRAENKKIKNDYNDVLTQLKQVIPDGLRVKGLEDILVKSKADVNFLMKEKDAFKGERSRVLSQMKGLLGDRRRVKKLESLLEGSSADIKAMKKENDVLRKEYNSLLVQVKASIIDKNRLKDAEEALEKNKTDMNLLVKDSEAAKAQDAKLKDKIKQFEEKQIKLVKERDTYKIADSAVKELKGGIFNLEKEKSGLLAQLKQAQRENEAVKKDYEGLLAQVNDLLVDKNKLKELGDIIENNKADKSLLEKDNKSVKNENLELKDKIKELESLQAQVSNAKDEYKAAYENERNDAAKNELKDGIVKLEKENLELRNKIEEFEFQIKAAHKQETSETLMKELKQMQKENELIKKDYASLLAQMKDLLVDSRRVKEMEAILQKDKTKMGSLEKEKESAKAENIALKDKIKQLEGLEKKFVKAGWDNGAFNEGGSESNGNRLKIKEIRPEDIILAKEDRQAALKQTEVKDAQLKELQSKFEAKKKQLSRQAEEYKKKYLKELERNDLAMQSASNLPQKFSDVVKKNEFLTRESAGMHYNLGVFFIKNKEYDRAIVEFEKAIELCPDDPYSYYNLGYIYAQYLIDRGKAVKYFRQYLQFVKNDDKDAEWVKDYLLTWEAYK